VLLGGAVTSAFGWEAIFLINILLYPVFGVLALTAIGGGYETIRNSTDSALAAIAGDRLIDVGGHFG
jgi:hypothetical protein